MFPSSHLSPHPKRSAVNADDRVLMVGRFAMGSRKDWINRLESVGATIETQISSETDWVVVGESGWPLRRNGQLPRDLLIAQGLATHSGRPVILGESDFFSRLQRRESSASVPPCRVGMKDNHDSISPVAGSVGDILRQQNLARLISSGVPIKRLRRALGQLRRWFPEAVVAGLALRDCSGVVGIRTSGGWMTPEGQRLFDFADLASDVRKHLKWSANVDAAVILKVQDANRTGPDTNQDLFPMAVEREREGDWRQAESLYRRLLRDEGPDADVCYNLANVLAAMGQVEAALERLSQAVELRPRFPEAWYNQGVLAQRMGQSSLAQNCFREALRWAPGLNAAVVALARTDSPFGA